MAYYEHAIVNTSRWETDTIVEWVEYYRELGFDHIYIYCNDDDPLEMYHKLSHFIEIEDPYVTFHFMPYQGQQPACWMHFFDHYLAECDWFMYVDADEFLVLKPHNSIKKFMEERANTSDCIHFNWIWFGPEGFSERPRGSTLLQFTHREDELTSMNFFTKTISRSSCINPRLIGRPPLDMMNHRWPQTVAARMREVNVLGESMAEFFSAFPETAITFMADTQRRVKIINTACIYHYLFRSKADLARRVARGILGAYYFQPMWGRVAENHDEMEGLLNKLGEKEDLYLRDFWTSRLQRVRQTALKCSIVDLPPSANIAISSSPTQSSLSSWSKGKTKEEDARNAITGVITGNDGFHTDIELGPWWMTDLNYDRDITEIRIFNSLKNVGMAARAYPLVVEGSSDCENWQTIFENSGHSPFGGADGHPLIIRRPHKARYVRLRLTTRDYFHLDQVEIYE